MQPSKPCARVCAVCFRTTSGKPLPRMVSQDEALLSSHACNRSGLFCGIITVTQSENLDGPRWVEVRERPADLGLRLAQICNYMTRGNCERGANCTFAHNNTELKHWDDTACSERDLALMHDWRHQASDKSVNRHSEIRARPFDLGRSRPAQMCLFLAKGSRCWKGENCTFAHSEAERKRWDNKDNFSEYTGRGEPEMCHSALREHSCKKPFCTYAHSSSQLASMMQDWNRRTGHRAVPTHSSRGLSEAVTAALEADKPPLANVSFEADSTMAGWNAPAVAEWLEASMHKASDAFFGKPSMYMGTGGTIPFMGMLGERFPEAQFLITGLLGPKSNAHGPNEFLHIETGKRLTSCVAQVLEDHYNR